MAGITIEMDNMLPWIGGIGGIVGYPVFLSIIDIIQDIYVLEEVDKDPIASDINVIDSWYELVNIGATPQDNLFELIIYPLVLLNLVILDQF